MRFDEYLDSHPKVRDVLFVLIGDTYKLSDLGGDFAMTLKVKDQSARTVEQLKMKCDLLGISYDECCECVGEYWSRLYDYDE